MPARLKDKTAVITGAASGIGAAAAQLFAAEGANLVLADIQADQGNELAKEIGAAFITTDVTNPSDISALASESKNTLGHVDVLFANAGLAYERAVDEMDERDWTKIINVNLTSTWLSCKHFLPIMADQGKGSIIATASQLGLIGMSDISAYGAAKGGVINLVRCLAAEYAHTGVRINALCPGPTRTPGTERMFSTAADPDKAVQTMFGKTLLRRLAEPNEIAWPAVFLASDESSYMTGAALVVDGGHTAI